MVESEWGARAEDSPQVFGVFGDGIDFEQTNLRRPSTEGRQLCCPTTRALLLTLVVPVQILLGDDYCAGENRVPRRTVAVPNKSSNPWAAGVVFCAGKAGKKMR